MDEIDSVRLPPGATLTKAALYDLLEHVRLHETIYKQAGAVHGCALATNEGDRSRILMFVEDVGRHNAVDAIAGQMWLDDIDGGDKIFYTTGRLTSEMVIKAAQMGIPFLVSRSGLTQMGHEIARKVGMTMIGRATNKHYLLFTGGERFRSVTHRRQSRDDHRHRAGRRSGPAHGRRRQGTGRARRQAARRARARAPRAAGRRDPDQRQPECGALCRIRPCRSCRTQSAASPARSPDCTRE